jgi:hypothetical protein
MKYKGLEYTLIQTIAPSGWRWSFRYLDCEFSGSNSTRREAVRAAERAIDNVLRLRLSLHN